MSGIDAMRCDKCKKQMKLTKDPVVWSDPFVGEVVVQVAEEYSCDWGEAILTPETFNKAVAEANRKAQKWVDSQPISDFFTAAEAAEYLGMSKQGLMQSRAVKRRLVYTTQFGNQKGGTCAPCGDSAN